MDSTSPQQHGAADLTGAAKGQQPTDAMSIHAVPSPSLVESAEGNSQTEEQQQQQQQDKEAINTPNKSGQSTPGSGDIHLGSKRHKESKHGHYEGEQQAKKQKKRIDLVDPEEDLKNAEYFIDNDLRKIKPYFFKYQTYAKGRWLGRKLIEVFNTEFRDRDNAFYERAIMDGRVKINDETVDKDYIIKNSDIVAHAIHRHEPPVANLPVRVVRNVDGVIIVDKPSSIPVHPSGRYRHNTVLHILMTEQGYKELYPVNRLDRLTSGLMIIALSVKKAREFEKLMQKCEIKKEYVCKVKGEFPSGVTECHQPIHVASFKLTLNTVHPDGKACSTIFERLSYDPESDTSIVLARPVTGRTHQIRVHLQWLGYPITNDPLYHNKDIWGALNGQGGITTEAEEELVKKLLAQTEAEDELDHALATSSLNSTEALTGIGMEGEHQHQKAEFCSICGLPSRADPEPEKRIMYLHAWKYQAKDWAFETELPEWAKDTVLAATAGLSSSEQGAASTTETIQPQASIT
ncbi:MAG: RNA pseudouridylate synthase domain-containing protein 2-like protein [Linnemannia gamsii]|nr:MAG: RNA pseudouridylate synthase domain-containing protein 2-like protein [Linnemannia gamsii]